MGRDSLAALSSQFETLAALARRPEEELTAARAGVSGWSAAQHIDHTLKVAISILRGVVEHDPAKAPTKPFSFAGKMILLLGYIPRGRGRSPESLRGEPAGPEEIARHLAAAREVLERVRVTPATPRTQLLMKHPLFGGMNREQALRFAVVHTHHHLKILRETVEN